jgi:IS6 family transposase
MLGGDWTDGTMTDFKWRHFRGDVILWAVRWYCRYPISYRDLEEMLAERGISVDHTTIYRWVQCYAPEMEKRLRWFWRRGFDPSWRPDETYVKVRGKWTYLYRAVDKRGDTIDFYLSPTRSAKAAKRSPGKALRGLKHWEKPATLNTDKAPSYGAAITELKREGKLDRETAHRQVKYLNNVIEADHGKLKILIKPVRGFKSIPTAYATIKGFEVMRALRKGRTGSPPVPAARHQGRGAPCGESFWHWALGADGGHGHAQPPFRSSRLIGAERQPTSDCRQSLQQSLRRHAHLALVHTSIEHSRDWCRSLLILNCQELAAQQPLRPINWCSRLLKMTLFVYNHEKMVSRVSG